MKDKDYIKDLFSEKLSGHEVPVRSDLWSGIQSQLGNTATIAAAKGISVAAKWMIGIASSVIVAGSVAWFTSDNYAEHKAEKQLSKLEDKKVSSQKEETLSPAAGLSSAPAVKTENTLHPHLTDGTETVQNNQPVPKEQMGHQPLIVKQRQEESPVNAAAMQQTPAVTENKAQDNKTAASSQATENNGSQAAVVGKIDEWSETNVFSPNNDGANDFFFLKSENLKEFSITVINDRNQVVYTSSEPDFKWDGIDRRTNEFVPAGNYGYVVIAADKNNHPIRLFKNLTVTK